MKNVLFTINKAVQAIKDSHFDISMSANLLITNSGFAHIWHISWVFLTNILWKYEHYMINWQPARGHHIVGISLTLKTKL